MARKEVITKELILNGAFDMAKEQGLIMVTARKLADKIGCSTQPIFRVYSKMDDLFKELFDKTRAYYENYYESYEKKNEVPFVDLGLAYIKFSQEEPKLFEILFLSKHDESQTMYDLINGSNHQGFVINEIKKIKHADPDQIGQIFMKIFTFIHGIACMSISGEFDLSEDEIVSMLEDAYDAFAGQ